MKELCGFVFDKLIDPLTLPIRPLYEWAIWGVIGIIAFKIAFRAAGDLYDTGMIRGSFFGSLFHWIIRLMVFVPIWFVVYWAIVIGQWMIANWVVVTGVLSVGIFVCVTTYLIKNRIDSKKNGVYKA